MQNISKDDKKNLVSSFKLLKITFGVIPIISGLDKFTNLLTYWEKYLPTYVINIFPLPVYQIMMIIGIVEIISGILMIYKPAIGGTIGAIMLTAISLSLIMEGKYLDEAIRIFMMAVGAFFIARNARILNL